MMSLSRSGRVAPAASVQVPAVSSAMAARIAVDLRARDLGVAGVRHRDEMRPGRRPAGAADALAGAVGMAREPALVDPVGDEAAEVGVHPPRHRQQDAPVGRDGRLLAEQPVEAGEAGRAGMRALHHLRQLARIADEHDVAGAAPHRQQVGEPDLPGLVDDQRVEGALELRLAEVEGGAADDVGGLARRGRRSGRRRGPGCPAARGCRPSRACARARRSRSSARSHRPAAPRGRRGAGSRSPRGWSRRRRPAARPRPARGWRGRRHGSCRCRADPGSAAPCPASPAPRAPSPRPDPRRRGCPPPARRRAAAAGARGGRRARGGARGPHWSAITARTAAARPSVGRGFGGCSDSRSGRSMPLPAPIFTVARRARRSRSTRVRETKGSASGAVGDWPGFSRVSCSGKR